MARTVLDELIVRLRSDPDLSGIRKFERGLDGAKRRMNAVGTAAVRAGVVLSGVGIAAVVEFGRFEQKLSEIVGLVGINRDVVESWKDELFALGDETGKAPLELAEGLYAVTSAGYRGEAVLRILGLAAKASAAGLGEMGEVARLLTGSVNVYGEDVLSAADATNQLIAAAREGTLIPSTLAGPLSAVLPFAAELGIEFGEVAGAMAALSLQNIDAARGATALRGIFAKLIRPTEMAKKELAKYGLTIDDIVAAAEVDLFGALMMLRTAFGDNREAMGKVFEDNEASRDVFALTGEKAEENAGVIQRVWTDTEGLGIAFGAGTEDVIRNWQQMVSAIRSGAIEIADTQSEVVVDFLRMVRDYAIGFREMEGAQKQMVGKLLTFGPAIVIVGAAINTLAWSLTPLLWLFKALRAALVLARVAALGTRIQLILLSVAQVATAVATAALTAVQALFTRALWKGVAAAIMSRTAMVAGAVALGIVKVATVAATVATADGSAGSLYPSTMEERRGSSRVAHRLVAGAVALGIVNVATVAATAVQTLFTLALWRSVAAAVVSRTAMVAGAVALGIMNVATLAATAAQWLWNAAMLANPIGLIIIAIAALAAAAYLIVKHWDTIKGFFAGLWDGIMEYFAGLSFFEAGKKLLMTLVDGIKSAASFVWDALTGIFDKVRDLLPFSDARIGPFSRLTEAGRAIVETLAVGVRQARPLDEVLATGAFRLPTLDQIAPLLPVGPAPIQAAAAGGVRGARH